jgi:hypothetical protein
VADIRRFWADIGFQPSGAIASDSILQEIRHFTPNVPGHLLLEQNIALLDRTRDAFKHEWDDRRAQLSELLNEIYLVWSHLSLTPAELEAAQNELNALEGCDDEVINKVGAKKNNRRMERSTTHAISAISPNKQLRTEVRRLKSRLQERYTQVLAQQESRIRQLWDELGYASDERHTFAFDAVELNDDRFEHIWQQMNHETSRLQRELESAKPVLDLCERVRVCRAAKIEFDRVTSDPSRLLDKRKVSTARLDEEKERRRRDEEVKKSETILSTAMHDYKINTENFEHKFVEKVSEGCFCTRNIQNKS